MSNMVDFSKIIPLLQADEEFSLTESQYLKSTGRKMPKGMYYLKNSSALAKLIRKYGFRIEVQERTILLKKDTRCPK